MISNKTREYRIENIRAIAILTVVLGHSMILYSNGFDIYQSGQNSAFFDYAKRFINLYQMPLFFSLSGYLFARSPVRTSASVFFRKKAARILLPFLLVGLFWLLPIRWAIRYPGYSECTLKGTIVMFLAGTDSGHLWFLPVLFLYFAVSYLLTKLFKNRLLTWTIAVLLGIGFALVEQLIPEMPLDTMYPRYFARYFWSFPAGALLCWRKDDLTRIFRKPLTRFLTAILCAAVMITAVFPASFRCDHLYAVCGGSGKTDCRGRAHQQKQLRPVSASFSTHVYHVLLCAERSSCSRVRNQRPALGRSRLAYYGCLEKNTLEIRDWRMTSLRSYERQI